GPCGSDSDHRDLAVVVRMILRLPVVDGRRVAVSFDRLCGFARARGGEHLHGLDVHHLEQAVSTQLSSDPAVFHAAERHARVRFHGAVDEYHPGFDFAGEFVRAGGSPTRSRRILCANFVRNSSTAESTTKKRLAAMQDCPQLTNRPATAPFAAASRSASPATMNGSDPPSSRTTFFRSFEASRAT